MADENSAKNEKNEKGNDDQPADAAAIRERVVETLKTVFDPEIPVNIYDLGLIYEINVNEDNHVHVKMTLTSPACPVAGTLPPEVERKIAAADGVESAGVELVWDPPWDQSKLSEAAKLQLGLT